MKTIRDHGTQLTKRWTGVTASLVAAGLLMSACGATPSSSGHNGGGGSGAVLTVAPNPTGPFEATYNPFLATSVGASGDIDNLIYEPLYMPDYVRATYNPWLATSYKWSDAGKVLTFQIRQGVKWSDGRPLTPSDVAFTFNLIRKNARLNTGALPLTAARAKGNQVVLSFSAPAYSYFDSIVLTKPVPEHIWANVKDPATFTNSHPVGSGPYTLTSFTPQVITLTRNPKFWQADKVKVTTVRFRAFSSAPSVEAALEAGQIDLEDQQFSDFKRLITRPGIGGLLVNEGMIFLLINSAQYPLNLVAVRQALSDALDRPAIAQSGLNGLQAPATSPTGLPSALSRDLAPAYKTASYGAANAPEAKRLLAKAGFKLGGNGIFITPKGTPLQLTILLQTGQAKFQAAAQVMQGELKAAGIGLSIQTEQSAGVTAAVAQGKYTLNLFGDLSFSPFDFYRPILDTRAYLAPDQSATYDLTRFQSSAAKTAYANWAVSKPGSQAATAARNALEAIMVAKVPAIPIAETGQQGSYNTRKFTGWPTKADPYALPEVIRDDAEVVMLHVRAK